MSLICIVATVLFGISALYISSIADRRDFTIIRALGLGKSFLYKAQLIKSLFATGISALMGFAMYALTLKFILNMMLGVPARWDTGSLILPAIAALLLAAAVWCNSFLQVRKDNDYNLLREQD